MALPASIDTLKASISRRGGMAKANRYAVYITHPGRKRSLLGGLVNADLEGIIGNTLRNVIGGGSPSLGSFLNDPRDIFLFCESTTLPGRQVATQDLFTDMKGIKKPYAYINDNVTMTFNLTNDYYMYKYMKSWMDSVITKDSRGGFQIAYKENYTTDIVIQQLGGTDYVPVYGVKLENAFPVTISSVNLSNTSENTISQITVTFEFDDWSEQGIVDGTLGNLGGLLQSTLIDNI